MNEIFADQWVDLILEESWVLSSLSVVMPSRSDKLLEVAHDLVKGLCLVSKMVRSGATSKDEPV